MKIKNISKNVLILGLGVSGMSLALFLKKGEKFTLLG